MIPLNICNHETWKHYPDLVHLSYLRTNNEIFVKKLLEAGILYTVLDTEGGVLEDFSILSRCLPDSKEVTKNCSQFFSWNEPISEYLIKNHFFSTKQITTTGQPRIDLYHKSFESRLMNKKTSEAQPYILFNSMFSFSNPKFSSKKRELQNAVNLFNSDLNEMTKQQKLEDVAMVKFIELTKKISCVFKNYNIIYRPHPFENEIIYLNEFKNFPNVHVTNNGNVDSWISNSICVIQLKCSTAFESTMLNIPTLLPIYIGDLKGDKRINDISHKLYNEEELINTITSIANGTYSVPSQIKNKQSEIIENIYFKQDGLAHVRVSNKIREILNHAHASPDKEEKCIEFKSQFSIHPKEKIFTKFAKHIIRNSFLKYVVVNSGFLEKFAIFKWRKSDKHFSLGDLQNSLDSLKKIKINYNSLILRKSKNSNYSFEIFIDD